MKNQIDKLTLFTTNLKITRDKELEDVRKISALISERSNLLIMVRDIDAQIENVKKKYSEKEFEKILDCCKDLIKRSAIKIAQKEINISEEMAKEFIEGCDK